MNPRETVSYLTVHALLNNHQEHIMYRESKAAIQLIFVFTDIFSANFYTIPFDLLPYKPYIIPNV